MRPLSRAFGIFLVVGELSTLVQYLGAVRLARVRPPLSRGRVPALNGLGQGYAMTGLARPPCYL